LNVVPYETCEDNRIGYAGSGNVAMPLFDYRCRRCGREFEALVRPQDSAPPCCPGCQSVDLERQLPTFAVSSAEKTQAAADQKRAKEARIARRDNIAMDIEAERHRAEDH
jgi:putative FmdB family regulatory protein